jgi:hypothetical protein
MMKRFKLPDWIVRKPHLKLQKGTTTPQNMLNSQKNDALSHGGCVVMSLQQRACGTQHKSGR